jgi:hypothetical protein
MKQLFLTLFALLIGQIIFRQVNNFAEIPTELLSNMDKMGIDSSLILNEYEGRYFNFIFKLDSTDFNIAGKKIYFSFYRSKTDYFADEKERFYRNDTNISSTLYIFNTDQKEEIGGYDAAIVSWRKRFVPIEEIIKWLKKKH